MAKQRFSDGYKAGSGNFGMTMAHMVGQGKVYLNKDHPTCHNYGKSDACNAYLGLAKAHIKSYEFNFTSVAGREKAYAEKARTIELIELVQRHLLNFGASIFSTEYATYKDSITDTLEVLNERIKELTEKNGVPKDFVLYGSGGLIEANLRVATTEIRGLERIFVGWVRDAIIPEEFEEEYAAFSTLLNLLSKWLDKESRHWALICNPGKAESTW